MAVDLEQVLNKRNEFFSTGLPTEESFKLFVQWLAANEVNLSSEALEYFDQILINFSKVAEKNIENMPESPEKRRAIRTAASIGGTHFKADGLLRGLEKEPKDPDPTLTEWSAVILKIHQTILDLLFDVTLMSKRQKQPIVFIGMSYACIDELTAALHLARHHYYAQASSHLRTVLESFERMELFAKHPEFIEIWAGDDKAKILKELKPSAVRKKLGRPSFDPLYGFLSEQGTHPTFEMFKGRTGRGPSDDGTARVFVAGTPFVHVRIIHFSLALIVGNLVIGKIASLFEGIYNREECASLILERSKEVKAFLERHFVPWANENSLEVEEFLQLFENLSTTTLEPGNGSK